MQTTYQSPYRSLYEVHTLERVSKFYRGSSTEPNIVEPFQRSISHHTSQISQDVGRYCCAEKAWIVWKVLKSSKISERRFLGFRTGRDGPICRAVSTSPTLSSGARMPWKLHPILQKLLEQLSVDSRWRKLTGGRCQQCRWITTAFIFKALVIAVDFLEKPLCSAFSNSARGQGRRWYHEWSPFLFCLRFN